MRAGFSPGSKFPVPIRILLFFALVFFFPGCRRSAEELPVTPPVTYPLARQYIGYGVVNVSFTHLLDEPGSDGVSRTYLRRGTVVRIMERRPLINQGNNESWVLAEGNYQGTNSTQGWLQESVLDIFDNEERANTASKTMGL